MVDAFEKCFSCLKPKTRATGGFVTQMIDICRCGEVPDLPMEAVESLPTCRQCRKSINQRRTGSMTQWIFRADFCQCDNPEPELCAHQKPRKHSFDFVDDDGEELELSRQSFPFERYQPKVKLGVGASGTVYMSRDRLLGKRVAVKVLHELTAGQLIAFQDEARTTSRLHHPNIIQVLDFGPTESGVPYMVLEYIDKGVSLEQYIRTNGPLPLDRAVAIFGKVCSALTHAHESGVFHRDLKPSNILLADISDGEPDVKLIDFGVAKVKYETQEPTIIQGKTIAGTPAYMPPEMVQGESFDALSETYTLGCVIFETLTGRPPFIGASAMETLAMHSQSPAPRMSNVAEEEFPESIESIVARCLSKAPKDRYQNLEELQEDLENILSPNPLQFVSTDEYNALVLAPEYTDRDRSDLQGHIEISLASVARPRPINPKGFFGAALVVILSGVFISMEIVHRSPNNKSSAASRRADDPVREAPLKAMSSDLATSDHDAIVEQMKSNHAFKVDVASQTWTAVERLSDNDLKRLADRSRDVVRCLRLNGGSIEGQIDLTDTAYGYVAKLPLRLFDAEHSSIKDSGLRKIGTMHTLRTLDLTDTSITDKGLRYLIGSNIQDLNVSSCLFLTEKCGRSLSKIDSLRVLNLSTTDVSDESIKLLARLPHLEELRLSNTSVSDSSLRNLSHNRTIKRLQLGGTKITIDGIRAIRNLPIEQIKVQSCKAFDDDCMILAAKQWPNLTSLDVDGTPITGRGLASIGELQTLELLTVAKLNASDEAMRPLLNLENLVSLNLAENPVSDNLMSGFARMPKLIRVCLTGCAGVTKAGVEGLKAAGKDVVLSKTIGGTNVNLNKEALEALIVPGEQ
ncbi:protein kinase [Candidatus Obscuribacterales bacterium]|nr:protein kinase [Candidatus Obscuribacterales bacterium]